MNAELAEFAGYSIPFLAVRRKTGFITKNR